MTPRRTFLIALAGAGLAAATARAQLAPGKEYALVSPPQPTDGGGKIEVIEFFSYACGHCFNLDPFLDAWVKKLPADVTFKRVPGVASEAWAQLALFYYSIEAMGLFDKLHTKAFEAIHKDNVNLANGKIREQWLAKNGVDIAQYKAVETSFSVQSRMARAKQLMGAYKIDGVPTLAVNGKYITSTGHAGGPERVVPVLEGLIAMARKESGATIPVSAPAATKPAPKK